MNTNQNGSGPKTGLVLTGGGARAAYQAGVLIGISEILPKGTPFPFNIITGVSAGAINGAYLGSQCNHFEEACKNLADLWKTIRPDNVMRTDAAAISVLGARWLGALSLGGLIRKGNMNHLLDTTPLKKYLAQKINFEQLNQHLSAGTLFGMGMTATNYQTGTSVSFYSAPESITPWARSARISVRSPISLEHVLASSAIPILFNPVGLAGSYYGDGGIRQNTPLSPAIHMGSDRILAIGIRHQRAISLTQQLNAVVPVREPSMADVAGVLLNALFLDSLDGDLERMERINNTVSMIPKEQLKTSNYPLRNIPILAIRPSVDLGSLMAKSFRIFPWTLRYLMRGLGASGERGWDFLSYLAFDGSYTGKLIELGHADAWATKNSILDFFEPR